MHSKHNLSQRPPRPFWDEYFLEIACVVSKRSHDPQTQCGAVLVSPSNEIIATGYNGFMRDVNETQLPNIRPDKYPFMIHAETNLLLSCARQGKSTIGCTVYVTGHPCDICLQHMWQAGINKIVYGNQKISMLEDKSVKKRIDLIRFLTQNRLEIKYVDYPRGV